MLVTYIVTDLFEVKGSFIQGSPNLTALTSSATYKCLHKTCLYLHLQRQLRNLQKHGIYTKTQNSSQLTLQKQLDPQAWESQMPLVQREQRKQPLRLETSHSPRRRKNVAIHQKSCFPHLLPRVRIRLADNFRITRGAYIPAQGEGGFLA